MKRQYSIRNTLITSVSLLTLLPMMTAMVISLVMFHRETTVRIRQENLKVAQTVATAVELPWEKLRRISGRITEIPGVNRCLYDLTPKPPATIEYI